MGHRRHLHINTQTYLTLCACKPAWGRVSEKLLPINQHGTCSCAPCHGCRAVQSLTETMVMSLQVYVSTHAEEHSCALLHGSERLCIPCCACGYAGRQVGERKKDLIIHNVLFLCPFFFYSVPPCAELQSPPLVFASQCGTLCCVRFYTYCIVCLLFLPFLSLLMVVCFLFMCGIKRPFEQQLSNPNERGCCFWKIQQKPEQNGY